MRIAEGWGDTVTIVDSDMRCWEAPEKADILVCAAAACLARSLRSDTCE